MTSARKAKANRVNARASTGPRSVQGKSISAQNARRHGLNLPVISDPVLSEDVEVLAREIAGEGSNDNSYQLARRIAEAQIDLRRIRQKRLQLLSGRLNKDYYESRASINRKMAVLSKLLECNAPEIPMERLGRFLTSTPEGISKFALIFAAEKKELLKMDRYERRALSRRKFAIRELDAVRSQERTNSNESAT